jgi:hypothetical protein
MATTTLTIRITDPRTSVSFPKTDNTFTLPLDASDPKAWTDFLKYIIEHPELIMAFLQLLAMLLGGLQPPPPPTP